ncbi:MAG: hypothetical protein ACRDVG_07300 [Jatrophihabitantaceae bacterium]
MTAARDELRRLVESLPEDQVAAVADDLRRRAAAAEPAGDWPPEFFGIIDGSEAPTDVAANVDLYLAAYGFGRDSL